MKKNYKNKKSNSAIYAQTFKSGFDFVELRRESVERGLIEPTDTPNRRLIARNNNMTLKEVELQFLENCKTIVASKPTIEVLSNSSGSASKATLTLDGHPLNPTQQAKDSSARVVRYRHVLNEMVGLFKTSKGMDLGSQSYNFEGDEIHAYAGVFSFTNSNMGNLEKEVLDLNEMVSRFWKKLVDARRRDGKTARLKVADDERGYGAPVAMLMSHEMTINPDKLEAMDGKGIYHPHVHFILFTDKKLNASVADDLYNIWDEITGTTYKTDRQAFTFAPAYSNSADKDASVVETLKETTKYLLDPEKWNQIALNENDSDDMRDFKIKLFSEYFKSYTGKIDRIRPFGLLYHANSYVNRFAEFENASIFNKSDILGDLLTQLNELKFNHIKNKYDFNYVRRLTDDEVIHENKSYISKILVSEDYKKELNIFIERVLPELKSDKDKLFAEYFKQKEFKSTIDDLYEMIDEEVQETNINKHKMHKDVFNTIEFRNAYNESFEVGNYDHFIKYRTLKETQIASDDTISKETIDNIYSAIELFGKACDSLILKQAIQNLIDSNNSIVRYSRDEIDARIFAKRLSYRQAVGLDPTNAKDVQFSQMFYQENGMMLPIDGRDSETIDLFVEEIDEYEELLDLFRVPDNKRQNVKMKLQYIYGFDFGLNYDFVGPKKPMRGMKLLKIPAPVSPVGPYASDTFTPSIKWTVLSARSHNPFTGEHSPMTADDLMN